MVQVSLNLQVFSLSFDYLPYKNRSILHPLLPWRKYKKPLLLMMMMMMMIMMMMMMMMMIMMMMMMMMMLLMMMMMMMIMMMMMMMMLLMMMLQVFKKSLRCLFCESLARCFELLLFLCIGLVL